MLVLAALAAATLAAVPVLAGEAPLVVPDHVAVVQPDGDVLPRPGVSWETLQDHGVEPGDVDGARPVGDGWSVPAKAAPPTWFDGTIRERLEAGETVPLEEIPAASADGSPAGVPAAEVGPYDEPANPPPLGIRPGMAIGYTPYCTTNFVFENTSNGDLAIGTAGHCVEEGEHIGAFMAWEEPSPGLSIDTFGEVVFRAYDPQDVPVDMALIDIFNYWEDFTSPRMAGWGGPCGARTSYAPGDSVVKWGQGTSGYVGSPRGGLVTGSDTRLLRWAGVQIPGDSGAGVRFDTTGYLSDTDAGAAGVATRFDIMPYRPWTANGPDTEFVQELIPDQWEIVSSPDCPPGPR